MSSFKTFLLKTVNGNKIVRKAAKNIMRTSWKVRFRIVDLITPTDDKTIVFKVYQGRQYTCSPRALYEEMLRNVRYADYHYIWVFREPDRFRFLEENRNTKVVPFGGKAYYKAFAQSKFWFVNSRTRQSLIPGKKHCYVQTWHGTPLKRLGCDIEMEGHNIVSAKEMKTDYKNEGKRLTYFLSPSEFYSEKMASAFAPTADKKRKCIIEKGYPRNDQLFRMTKADVKRVKARMGIPPDKKVILYAPTFRDNQHTRAGCTFSMGFEMENFCREFGDSYVMLFRTHYFVTEHIDLNKWAGIIYDVTAWTDINELYMISDMLITDYSSVFFDYANLKRPIIFFMYDLQEYQQNIRDFYLDIDQLPGNIILDEQGLYAEIRRLGSEFVFDGKYQEFHDTFNYLDGPDTARKVLECLGV